MVFAVEDSIFKCYNRIYVLLFNSLVLPSYQENYFQSHLFLY